MMAFRVVRRGTVHYLDTPLEPQFHKPSRLWQPGRLTGDSPDTRRTLAGHSPWITFGLPGSPPAFAGPRNISQACGQRAAGTRALNERGRRSNSSNGFYPVAMPGTTVCVLAWEGRALTGVK